VYILYNTILGVYREIIQTHLLILNDILSNININIILDSSLKEIAGKKLHYTSYYIIFQ